MEAERRFLIRGMKFFIVLLVGAILYFAWVLAIGAGYAQTPNVPLNTWVTGGLALFGFALLYGLLLLIPRPRRRKKKQKAKKRRAREMDDLEPQVLDLAPDDAGTAGFAPPVQRDEEIRVTKEMHKGMRVLEISHPPKSLNQGALYSKAIVAVDEGWAIRVEELVVGPEEVQLARNG